MRGLEIAGGLALRHQHQRSVDRHHLIEKDRDVHGPRLRHAIVAFPGAVVLMPLPDVAGEGRFGVDLVLVHVDLLAEDLLDRIDHARMRAEQAERLIIEMRGKGGARRAALFAPHLRAVGVVDAHGLLREQGYFFRAEQLGQEQPALAVEIVDLLLGQFHGGSSFWFFRSFYLRHSPMCNCTSWMRHLAQARNPYSRSWLWIPGSRCARPGMTNEREANRYPVHRGLSIPSVSLLEYRIIRRSL